MRSKHYVRWIAPMAVLLSGCAATRQYPAPPILPATTLVEISDSAATCALQYESRTHVAAVPPKNALVLSGGGVNGAYAAGLLKGWTDSGTRPQFDVVTGISTGALIAPYAFLGSEYDAELERLYTSMRQENVFRPRLLWLDSLVSSEPLEQQIAARRNTGNPAQNRRSTPSGPATLRGNDQSRYKETCGMGYGGYRCPQLGGKQNSVPKSASCLLLDSGLLPPVPIDVEIDGRHFTELHVDGGVTACAFLQPAMLGIGPNGEAAVRHKSNFGSCRGCGKTSPDRRADKARVVFDRWRIHECRASSEDGKRIGGTILACSIRQGQFQGGGHPTRL